jgi:hypothetical protein
MQPRQAHLFDSKKKTVQDLILKAKAGVQHSDFVKEA